MMTTIPASQQVPVPTLAVDRLVAGYGGLRILREVSIRVGAGELVVIIGPNGSGKSTLLKAVFGLVTIESGSVSFEGRAITGFPPERCVALGLALTPQTDNIFPSLSIEENLEMGAFLRPDLLRERLEFIYTFLPMLAERRRAPASHLSGGQRQMLAIGRALMTNPRLLLLDEPSAGLAPNMTESIFGHIATIRQAGTSILLVEQNAKAALAMCDRAYVLATGRNQLEGSGRELLDNPEIRRLYLGG